MILLIDFILLLYVIFTKNKRHSLPITLNKIFKKWDSQENLKKEQFWVIGGIVLSIIFIPFFGPLLVIIFNRDDNENDFSFN